jgi:hypothetical protein
MDWKPGVKQLMLMGDGSYFEFPSKRAAHNAIWHTVQASGAAMSHVDYSVEEV